MKKFLFAILVNLSATLPLAAAPAERVDYRLEITDPVHHLARVEVSLPATSEAFLDIHLPAWRTGRYEILNLAQGIRHLVATDAGGNALQVKKLNKDTWRIKNPAKGAVRVSYDLYANQLAERVRHIDASHAFLDASGVFVYAENFRALPATVTLKVPDGWQSHSGMERGEAPHSFVAENYDHLVDSPIETGIHQYRSFSAGNRDYELVVWGEGNYDLDAMVEDLVKLDGIAKTTWQEFPFRRYLYIVHATDGARGATEHVNSTVIQRPRFLFAPREEYVSFITTAAHEFVHTWNVKGYRPQGIYRYDYLRENYSPLLWFVEGGTSYYDGLLAVRSEVITGPEFLKELAEDIGKYSQRPGRISMSLAQASFDQWIADRGDWAQNSSVNIYSKGKLVSLLLDQAIREASNDRHSLDDVHRRLYRDFPVAERGYREADILAILKELTGRDFDNFWRNYVAGTRELDFDKVLGYYGLELAPPMPESGAAPEPVAWLGIKLNSAPGGDLVLSEVWKDGPAWQGGLVAGDRLIAVDNYRITAADADSRLALLPIGEAVTLHIFRDGQLMSVEVTAEADPGALTITPKQDASPAQKRRYQNWLGHPMPDPVPPAKGS